MFFQPLKPQWIADFTGSAWLPDDWGTE